jgi:hypothetical protein
MFTISYHKESVQRPDRGIFRDKALHKNYLVFKDTDGELCPVLPVNNDSDVSDPLHEDKCS